MGKTTAVAKPSEAAGSLVDPEQILKASKALLAHIKKAASQDDGAKKNLLADPDAPQAETPVWLTLTTKRHIKDSARLQPAKIPLPHSLNADAESTICIITADPQRAYKNMVASEEFPEDLRKQITRIIDLTHLKAKFKAYEAQRKLFSEHDIFLADDRIINQLPKVLGKTFFKTTAKRPIPVVLMAARERVDGKRVARPAGPRKEKREPAENANARPPAEIVAEVRKALGAALVHLSPSTNTAVKVGYAGWPAEHLAANVETVAAVLVGRFVPQKWDNVRSLYLKGPETAALPLWQTDELWADDAQVVADGEDAAPAAKSETANVGKKRKSLGAGAEAEGAADEPKGKTRAAKKAKLPLPESNDDKLDKEIAERKERLKKQKKAAKKAIEA